MFNSLFRYLLSQNFMLRIKELNLTCMINDSERITEKLGPCKALVLVCLDSKQKAPKAGKASKEIEKGRRFGKQ